MIINDCEMVYSESPFKVLLMIFVRRQVGSVELDKKLSKKESVVEGKRGLPGQGKVD